MELLRLHVRESPMALPMYGPDREREDQMRGRAPIAIKICEPAKGSSLRVSEQFALDGLCCRRCPMAAKEDMNAASVLPLEASLSYRAKSMRYTERQMTGELLDQPAFAGEPKKLFICSTPRSGSYLLCRYMINTGLGVPRRYFNPIIMRQIAPRLGLGPAIEGLKWRRRSPLDRLPFGKAARTAEVNFLEKYVAALVPRRSQQGVFAAKLHFEQYTKVLDNPVGWKLLNGGIFVHLYREIFAQPGDFNEFRACDRSLGHR